MEELITFSDVLIKPKFSTINSRSEVDLSGKWVRDDIVVDNWSFPIVTANMDTITGVNMVKAVTRYGGLACLHRFWSIGENVEAWKADPNAWVSVGLGEKELQRAKALHEAGARIFVLDVAHAAQAQVAKQYVALKRLSAGTFVIVGNFATVESFNDFYLYINVELGANLAIDGIKVGIGPGSACTTRIKTGVGVPQLQAIIDMRNAHGYFKAYEGLVIADGGCKTSGDIAKALAAGADLVMVGGMLAGTDETPGEVISKRVPLESDRWIDASTNAYFKKYRGSASKESYDAQGKDAIWRTAEGESFMVECKGPVSAVLQDIEGGLRSALTYVGAKNLREFREKAEFVRITSNGVKENGAHGKQ